jgi:alkanesulfonate monooxygenase
MPAEFVWTIPLRGDGRRARYDEWNRGDWHQDVPATLPSWVRDDRGSKFDSFDHISAVVKAAEHGGFSAISIPYDPDGEESWIVAGTAVRETRWVRTIVGFSPSVTTPVYAAKMAATFQRISGGRQDWNLELGLSDDQAASQGDFVRGDDRVQRADEFLTIARSVWKERDFDFDGRFYAVDAGGFGPPLNSFDFPRIFLSGNSPQVLALAAKHADVHLLAAGDDQALDQEISVLGDATREAGGTLRVGLSLPIVAREDTDEAWARVDRLWSESGDRTGGQPVEASRLSEVVWSGFDRLGFSHPVGLVGSYSEVQRAIEAYVDRGIEVFVLDGYPHVEEAYRLGEHLLSRFDPLAIPAGTRVNV